MAPLVKLIDFGTTKWASEDSIPNSVVGTYLYYAPEARGPHLLAGWAFRRGLAPRAPRRDAAPAPRPAQVFRAHSAESNGHEVERYDGVKVDTWCVGITLFMMLCGANPVVDLAEGLHNSDKKTGMLSVIIMDRFDKNIARKRKLVPTVTVSPECRDFIKRCLTFDPDERPTVEALMTLPWLQGAVKPAVRCCVLAPSLRSAAFGPSACAACIQR